MWKKYVPYVTSIILFTIALLGITLVAAFIYGAIVGVGDGAGLFLVPRFFRTAADALFFEGGIILTLGAMVEFLFKSLSPKVAQAMMSPASKLFGRYMTMAVPDDAYLEEGRSGGWMLIFIGALLIIASLAFAFIVMK